MWHNSKKKKKRTGTGRRQPPSDNTSIDASFSRKSLQFLRIQRRRWHMGGGHGWWSSKWCVRYSTRCRNRCSQHSRMCGWHDEKHILVVTNAHRVVNGMPRVEFYSFRYLEGLWI
ncbi:hypothetical protein Hdeb2414_s0004g00135091 [Helianthus debilis subsp. tardiflorus]